MQLLETADRFLAVLADRRTRSNPMTEDRRGMACNARRRPRWKKKEELRERRLDFGNERARAPSRCRWASKRGAACARPLVAGRPGGCARPLVAGRPGGGFVQSTGSPRRECLVS